jgi:hypothetical protein
VRRSFFVNSAQEAMPRRGDEKRGAPVGGVRLGGSKSRRDVRCRTDKFINWRLAPEA